jgi:hypothetical protein
MPIRLELRCLYPPDWRDLSRRIRFGRAGGRCETCRRPHARLVCSLPDGRWYDADEGIWRSGVGSEAAPPALAETLPLRIVRVVLASAHLDHDPTNNAWDNLRALCQRCHLLHDRPHHAAQRWITCRRRYALGDLFLGRYDAPVPATPWPARPRSRGVGFGAA